MRLLVYVVLVLGLLAARGNAQCTRRDSAEIPAAPRSVGTAADDSARLGTVIGACWADGSLIRSLVSMTPTRGSGFRFSALEPSFASTWNSRLPHSVNDGAMWAGRGLNLRVAAGFRAELGRARLIFAPGIVTAQNAAFPVIPSSDDSRSDFASPWYDGPMVADLPIRFGNQRYTLVDLGESAFEISLPAIAVGAASSTAWWGPGIRNALVMSDNAAGIPRVYVRTAHPLSLALGTIEAQWMLGGLTESPFFDIDERNNLRSVSAAAVTLRLAADTGLTIGAARAVYAGVRRFGRVPGHALDVFVDWHRAPTQGAVSTRTDQVTSLFARWVIPGAGVAAHAEWAKVRLPASLRELLVDPHEAQGYTLGLEWARALDERTTVRARAEATMLEQTPESSGGVTPEFYASHTVIQGYTQMGQSVGAAIGPGSSSQYADVDVFRGAWRLGAHLGRIRWQEGAYYRPPSQGRFAWRTHDVSLFGGLTASLDSRWARLQASATQTLRLNYLFQTPDGFLPANSTFDVPNTTLSLTVTPHLFARRARRAD